MTHGSATIDDSSDAAMRECALLPLIDNRTFSDPAGEWRAAVRTPPPNPSGDRITCRILFRQRNQESPARTLYLSVSESSLNLDSERGGHYRERLLNRIWEWLGTSEVEGSMQDMG
jgi:hypothetical protein